MDNRSDAGSSMPRLISPIQVWGGRIWQPLLSDLRYAVRQLRKSPAFAIAVISTLAIVVGANTAIFSVVHAALLQPLPFADPSRILCIWHGDGESYPWYTFSYPRFLFFQQALASSADLAAYGDETVTFSDHGQPIRLEGGRVSSNFFPLLGVHPEFGRNFLPGEDRHGANQVVLLSDPFWRERYHSDPRILRRTVVIGGEESTRLAS
jgi:putative ABC transport system permease protein